MISGITLVLWGKGWELERWWRRYITKENKDKKEERWKWIKRSREKKKIAKERKVIPDPIDDRKFHEWKESGKSGILLGITLNPKKCIGEKVRRIPINVETKW